MIKIKIYEDDERNKIIGILIFSKTKDFFKYFFNKVSGKSFFNYTDFHKMSRNKKKFVIIKTK